MREKVRKYLSGEREGFSLVELIIVIAIMAILIAVVALVVIPYLESSRESDDRQALESVAAGFKSACALSQTSSSFSNVDYASLPTDVKGKLDSVLDKTVPNTETDLSSNAVTSATGKFYFTYQPGTGGASPQCYVIIGDSSGTVVTDSDGKDFSSGK